MDTVFVVVKETFTSESNKYLKGAKVVYVSKDMKDAEKWAGVAEDNSTFFNPTEEAEFYIKEMLMH